MVDQNADVNIGKVNYIDYQKDDFEAAGMYQPFIHKRISFEHEKETRAITHDFLKKSFGRKDFEEWTGNGVEFGRLVKIDVDKLIEKIYTSPTSQRWFFDLVGKTLNKYGLSIPIKKSTLTDPPPFS